MSICWNRSQISRQIFAQSRYANARLYSCLPARLISRFCENKILTCIGTKVPRISLLDVVKNKELLVFTGTLWRSFSQFTLSPLSRSLEQATVKRNNLKMFHARL